MAYAALLSLTQTLEQILGSPDEIRGFHDEEQIKSLHEKLSFLLSFLEDSLHKNTESMTCLEARIRDATNEAEDIIELHISKSASQGVFSRFWEIITSLPVFHNYERFMEFKHHNFKEIYEGLQKVMKEVDSILVEVENMKDMNDTAGSSKSSSGNKSAIVDQIKSLHEKLSILLSFLEDSSHKNTESITCLESRIRAATFEAEDIIELHMSKPILSDSDISCFWEIISALHNSERRMELERHSFKEKYEDLQKVIKEIDSISEEVEKMKAMNDIEGSSADGLMQIKDPLSGIEGIEEVVKNKDGGDIQVLQPTKSLRATSSKSSSINKNAMVGFEDDLLQIKERLVGQSSMLKFISIVGMGGIGKTTLARNIYNDSYIEHHFDIRAWTTLSQEYRVQELLVHLLKSMGDLADMNRKETDELKTLVYQCLKGNRYLIIMDDVWDGKVLDEFRRIFPDDNNGSRIILTTRLYSVAVYADSSSPIHHLSFLSPKQSWNLLCQKALGNECCPPELEEIGKRIAEKCKGLPLALVVIGGVLYKTEKTRADWEYVAENVKSAVTGNDDDFMEILAWSYNRLPHRLRACFLYMGVFPEDYVIHVSHLIRLWVAEGFIKPIEHNSLEEVAKQYLEELIDRNLIMVHLRVYEIKTCSMHDIMRELCLKKAQEEKFLYIANREVEFPSEVKKNHRHPSIMKNHPHLSIHGTLSDDIADTTFRSLLYFKVSKSGHSPTSILLC